MACTGAVVKDTDRDIRAGGRSGHHAQHGRYHFTAVQQYPLPLFKAIKQQYTAAVKFG